MWFPLLMGMHLKCVPQNRALLNAQLTQFIPDYRGRAFGVGLGPAGESVIHLRYARNLPIQQLTFASKRDPAVPAPAMTRRFTAKNKLRFAVEMGCEPGQLCIWTIAWLVVVATVAPWVEQVRSGRESIGEKFGQLVIGHQYPLVWLLCLDYRKWELSIVPLAFGS